MQFAYFCLLKLTELQQFIIPHYTTPSTGSQIGSLYFMSTNKSSGLVQIDCNSRYSICLKETIALLMQIHFVHEFYIYFKETTLLFK